MPSLHPFTLSLQALTSRHLRPLSTASLSPWAGPHVLSSRGVLVCRLFTLFPCVVSVHCLFTPSPPKSLVPSLPATASRHLFPPSLHAVASCRFFALSSCRLCALFLYAVPPRLLFAPSLQAVSSANSIAEIVAAVMAAGDFGLWRNGVRWIGLRRFGDRTGLRRIGLRHIGMRRIGLRRFGHRVGAAVRSSADRSVAG